jgi:hypothetical protein
MREEELQALDSFGKLFMEEVRDRTINNFEAILSGKTKSQKSQLLHKQLATLDNNTIQILKEALIETIDNQLFNTLTLLEQNEELSLLYNIEEKPFNINEISDGLGGELFTENGWIEKFSKYKNK